jgi:hypothetical protein
VSAGGFFVVDDEGTWRDVDLVETLGGLAQRGCVRGVEVATRSQARADVMRAAWERHQRASTDPAPFDLRVADSDGPWARGFRRARRGLELGANFVLVSGAQARLSAALCAPRLPLVLFEESRRPGPGFLGFIERFVQRRALKKAKILCAGRTPRPRAGREPREFSVGWGQVVSPDASDDRELRPPSGEIGLWTPPGSAAAPRRMIEAFRALAATDDRLRLVVLCEGGRSPLKPWPEDFGLEDRVGVRDLDGDLDLALAGLDLLWMHAGAGEVSEPDPRVAIAALARGCPLVIDHHTSLAPGIGEIGGALMRDGHWPQQFAEASREVLSDEALRGALRRAGPILVAERYRREDYYDRLAAVLMGLFETSKG